MLIFLHIRPAKLAHMISDKFRTVMQLSHVACQERLYAAATHAPTHYICSLVASSQLPHTYKQTYMERLRVALPVPTHWSPLPICGRAADCMQVKVSHATTTPTIDPSQCAANHLNEINCWSLLSWDLQIAPTHTNTHTYVWYIA